MDEERHYDFSGWATKNDVKCADGRTIRSGAFAHMDGVRVPLVYNHSHSNVFDILGHTVLENRPEGVYCYGWFNDTDQGKQARAAVENGDVNALSIYANKLQQKNGDVLHGNICEVSLVLAGANPEAYIDSYFKHSADGECIETPDEAHIMWFDTIELYHSAESDNKEKETKPMAEEAKKPEENEESLQEIYNSMSEKQQKACDALAALCVADALNEKEEGDKEMKHSIFEGGNTEDKKNVLQHSDEVEIINLAKQSGVGSLKAAIGIYEQEHNCELAHGFEGVEELFPEYKNLDNGEPETITRDYTWVDAVIDGAHKSPVTRIRTRQIDARNAELKAMGYTKGDKKKEMATQKLLKRTTDPQTVYIKDKLNRDDILDVEDFNLVDYQWKVMKGIYRETIAMAIMVGDQREEDDADKISEEHIRPIWKDDELYAMHVTIDIAGTRASIQGSDTSKHFGDNFIYSEAAVAAILNAREKYKGSGQPKMYTAPALKNKMLLARDITGNRMYKTVSELASALDVNGVETAEQFAGLVRTDEATGKKYKLLAILVNMKDYQLGTGKGGEVTKFSQFDIDFNQEKMLMEGRSSGALIKPFSAIVLEEEIVDAQG